MIPTTRHQPYFVPREEVARRIEALQTALRSAGVELAWIDHLADRLYFAGSSQDGILLVPADRPATFYVRKSLARAQVEAGVSVEAYPGAKSLGKKLRAAVGDAGRAGLAMDVTPAATFARLIERIDSGRFVDLSSAVRAVRAVKSPWELEQLRRASDQVTTLYAEVPDLIRPGVTELELTGRVEGRLRSLGHGGTIRVRRPGSDITMGVVVAGDSALYPTSFNGCVGAEGPYPTAASGGGWKPLAEGETVMLDLVTVHNGYHADTTRTFFVGDEPPEQALRAHGYCLEILRAIEERLRPGRVCSEIYREVDELASARGEVQGFMGHGENRVRFFGHGVGLELDEMPVLAERIDVPLESGMVLAVEPKAFVKGLGPVGIENTYLVTPEGPQRLSDAREELVPVGR
jgi:Xaa-Pro aminopeptidase